MNSKEAVEMVVENVQKMDKEQLSAFLECVAVISLCFVPEDHAEGVLLIAHKGGLHVLSLNTDFAEAGHMTKWAAHKFESTFKDMDLAREHAH